jgi:hypothetical protein
MAAGYQTTIYNKGTGVVTIALITATDKLDGTVNGTLALPAGAAITCAVNQAANGYETLSRADAKRSSFTLTLTGFTATITGTAVYSLSNNVVTLYLPVLTGTSNAITMTGTGLPAEITPTTTHFGLPCIGEDNGSVLTSTTRADIKSTGVIDFFKDFSGTGWTNSGTKGLAGGATLTYNLN